MGDPAAAGHAVTGSGSPLGTPDAIHFDPAPLGLRSQLNNLAKLQHTGPLPS